MQSCSDKSTSEVQTFLPLFIPRNITFKVDHQEVTDEQRKVSSR